MDLVSIIIPVYNVEPYLEECLESVLRQTYRNIEIILVDDGSEDRSGQICETYEKKDSRVKVLHQKNSGPSVARNRALDICEGDWIAFIDSDDVVWDRYIETMLRLANENSARFVQCRTNTTLLFNQTEGDVWHGPAHEFLLSEEFTTMDCAKLYHASTLETIRFPEGRLHEDDALVYKAVYAAETVTYTTAELYGYRQREGSITVHKKYNLKQLDKLLSLKEMMQFYSVKNEKALYKKTVRNYGYELLEDYGKVKRDFPQEKEILKDLHLQYSAIVNEMIDDHELKPITKGLLWASRWFPSMWTTILRI
jgi:glycosyltransferase involved in cell wall biosynthesis